MLYEIDDPALPFARLAPDVVRGFTIRKFCERRERYPARLLVDDRHEPRVLIGLAGAMVNIVGEFQVLNAALADLRDGKVETHGGWPTPEIAEDWQRSGKRYLYLNASSYASWRAARIAGFDPELEDRDGYVAYQWHFVGAPRFGHLIQHPCRVIEGLDLLEYMKLGVPYDQEGHYISLCLKYGPSFVCEVPTSELPQEQSVVAATESHDSAARQWFKEDDASARERPVLAPLREGWTPVCWSCTHLTGLMGMIYTPPELRRYGYARSLAALQIDTMLDREGIACCHIIDWNTPSMKLVHSMGAESLPEPIVWRTVYWPGEGPTPASTP